MEGTWTRRRFAGCAAAALGGAMAGCGGGPPKVEETALKISYFRSVKEPKTKRPGPVYRVVMSESWRDVMGESPREPFMRAAGRQVYVGYLRDLDLQKFVGLLRQYGIDRLASREPESYDPNRLAKLASEAATATATRIFTVGSDKGHVSYDARDQAPGSQSNTYIKCEDAVAKMVQYSYNFRTGTEPFMRDKR